MSAGCLPYGLAATTVKPSYGMAEATLFVSTIARDGQATEVYLDRDPLGAGHAVRVAPDAANAVKQVSCGRVARSQWAAIVDPETDAELPDGEVGEIWLHGDNLGRGYWGRAREIDLAFHNKVQSRLHGGSHTEGSPAGASRFRTIAERAPGGGQGRSGSRRRGGTRCRLPTCDWSPRALFRAPRAGNRLAGPAAPSI